MILTKKTVQWILESLDLRRDIGKALDCSDDWIRRLAKKNEPNSDLTKYEALRAIREFTKLSDQQILVDEVVATTKS